MKTIFVVMDSLNRHFLNCYGSPQAITPNIDRIAERGIVFDKHWCGSMPCMPARREMMTGRYNFLETPWGPIEPWDDCLPVELRQQRGVYSHMITDHYHYFHSGGEAYHTLFDSYEFERGQESDKWHPLVNAPAPPDDYRGKGDGRKHYWMNRQVLDQEDDLSYPTPRCYQHAVDFLENNHEADNWHLHLEVFDPHEPFDCPAKYLEMYNDDWDGPFYSWPSYSKLDEEDSPEAVRHIRKRYAATLTMNDFWLGKLLDKMDEHNMWEDTVLILTTDHGHMLSEHGYWAKNYMFDYAYLTNIPLLICAPGCAGGQRRDALTVTIDLMPTIMGLYNAELPPFVHGKSMEQLLKKDESHHSAVLYGYFGKDINMFDGRYTYCRQPLADSFVHQHTAMPRAFNDFISRQSLSCAETGCFLSSCYDVPHYRFELPSFFHADAPDFNPIFDLNVDPEQQHPVHDPDLERSLAKKMKALLKQVDAPACQYIRTGLNKITGS